MSQAEELLDSLSETTEEVYSSDSETEPHIVVGKDRYISVPEELQRIAVQGDHDVETVTFDCPRYSDGRDLSTFQMYVMYVRPDGSSGKIVCDNLAVDDTDDNVIHFDWTITNTIAKLSGPIVFFLRAKKTDADGNEVNVWNTELNTEMYVSKSEEVDDTVIEETYPDIITQLLSRMDATEKIRYNAPITLDGTTDAIEWDYTKSDTAVVTLTEDKALTISNEYNGARASLDVYGGKLILDDSIYLKSATYTYLEAVEGEHYHYEFQKISDKWQVCMTVMEGAEVS